MDKRRDPVASFRATAERFVAVVEAAGEEAPERGWLSDVASSLAQLYEAALHLPFVSADSDEPPPGITHEQWQATFERLKSVFGPDDLYWTVVPSATSKRTELARSLADDLADVYRDLKDGLDLLAKGGSENDAVWTWHLMFWSHWGSHATEALRAIHARLADTGLPSG